MEELQKSLRDQYSDDNEAYKAALASNGITPGNSTGKVRSIQQAYYDGNIDKGTRDYMMADAIAKFARNTGRDIGNIGAQFTGGTVNNNFETSDWNKRNEELFKQQTSAEAATIANSDKAREATAQNLANEKSDKALAAPRVMEEYKNKASAKAEELRKDGNDAGAAIMEGIAGEYALLTSGATSSIDKEEHIGNILASLGSAVASGEMSKADMMEYAKPLFAGIGTGTGTNINISNPFAKDKTGNTYVAPETSNDRNSNFVNMGVTDDIRGITEKFAGSDPTGKREIVKDLYQEKGGKADRIKLATLVIAGEVDPNEKYGVGLDGTKVINSVMKDLEDENFVKDFEHYTGKGDAAKEALVKYQREEAHKAAAKDAKKFKMDVDNLSEDNINTLKGLASQSKWGSADDMARRILDYLEIPY